MSKLAKEYSFCNQASTSQEGLEEEAPSLPPNKKIPVTLLSTEWKSSKGGLSTINRELAIQLAQHPDVDISVYLPQCSEDDRTDATRHNVQLIEAEELPGFDPIHWLSVVPRNHVTDCVVGHGVLLGRYAQLFKRQLNCRWIQVVHTAPEELGKYKTYEDAISKGEKKHQAEVKLCEIADQVVAVGPKLKEAFARCLRPCQKDQAIVSITPSIFSEFSGVKQADEERKTFSALVLGRGESDDFELKGHDIVAQAIGQLKDKSYHLMFVGAPAGKEDVVAQKLQDCGIACGQLTVRCFDESREQLSKLLCEADLAVMPSRTEGFGLAGLEALSAGLPVLVSGNSGFGEALKKVPYGSSWIVDSEEPQEWAKAIRNIREKDRKLRLEEVKFLRERYTKEFSWQDQCRSLVERMKDITSGTKPADEQDSPVITPGNLQENQGDSHPKSLEEGSSRRLVSRKGKRPSSSRSGTPSPRKCSRLEAVGHQGTTPADEQDSPVITPGKPQENQGASHSKSLEEGSSKRLASRKGKRPSSRSGTPSEKKCYRLEKVGHQGSSKRLASRKGKRPSSHSGAPSQKKCSRLEKVSQEDHNTVVKILKAGYKRRSLLKPLPWSNTIQLPIEDIYTRMKVVSQRKERKKESNVVSFSDILECFNEGGNTMTLVEGSPGMGKSTFCLKIAHDWANAQKFPLPKLKFVLLLKCCDIDGDIMEAISQQLLPEDLAENARERLINHIKDMQNQENILIILDGLDELPQNSKEHVNKLLDRRILPFCYILATCRQERGISVRVEFNFDILLQIEGFMEKDAFEYIRKHFDHVSPRQSLNGEKLIQEIQDDTLLSALCTNPLNLLLLCVVYEDYEGKLPSSRARLYQIITHCILKRYCAKQQLKTPDDDNVLDKLFQESTLALGELAWNCLLEDRHSFREEELTNMESSNKGLKARFLGLVFKEASLKRLNPKHDYYFLHKTFQQYLAATYLAHRLQSEELNVFEELSLKFDDVVLKHRQVFLFICGVLDEEASILFRQIGQELKSDWDWLECREEEATFFIESFSESTNPENMADTLCSFLPFPKHIEIVSSFDCYLENFLLVLKACKSFSVQQPEHLIVPNADVLEDGMVDTMRDALVSCIPFKALSISGQEMTPALAAALYEGLSANSTLSDFSLNVFSSIPFDIADVIGNGLAASKTLTAISFTLREEWDEAWAVAIEKGLAAADTELTVQLNVDGSMSDAVLQALVRLFSNTSLLSLSLVTLGDLQDSLASAVSEGLAAAGTELESFSLVVDGNLSHDGALLLQKGLLENRTLRSLVVEICGEPPDNWTTVVQNVSSSKRSLERCDFQPNPLCNKIT